MKLSRSLYFGIIIALIHTFSAVGQSEEAYLFPINPGQTNFLAGTMGELRSSHFHAGIDIKTGGREGLNVYASKRGYITRIKISTSGYGNALYMLHPDGNTTVYAHLKSFEPELEAWVKEQQYAKESFEIQLFPKAYQFAYEQGDVIAFSGNTGGSTGPHLHFEIRDAQQRVLNPLHYGFKEIRDNIAPILQDFALRPMDESTRIEGLSERFFPELNYGSGNYKIEDTIKVQGTIGLELKGHDKLNGAANQNGISKIEVYINGQRYYYQNIDSMYFSTQRHILVHYPFDLKQQGLGRFHKLYVDDGNKLRFYHPTQNKGILKISEDSIYDVNIKMYDPYLNKRELSFVMKGTSFGSKLSESINFQIDDIAYTVSNDLLSVYVDGSCLKQDEKLSLFVDSKLIEIEPSYYQDNIAVYRYNLNEGVPQSVASCERTQKIGIDQAVYPSKETSVMIPEFTAKFTKYSLFDSAFVDLSYRIQGRDSLEIFTIEPTDVPLKSSVHFIAKPQNTYSKDKATVYQVDDNGDFYYEGGEWVDDHSISFTSRSMGSYTILEDHQPPTIRQLGDRLSFVIDDNLSGIESFRAELNGKWVLMKYEPKKNLIWVQWPDTAMAKEGEFKLLVKDKLNNTSELILNL